MGFKRNSTALPLGSSAVRNGAAPFSRERGGMRAHCAPACGRMRALRLLVCGCAGVALSLSLLACGCSASPASPGETMPDPSDATAPAHFDAGGTRAPAAAGAPDAPSADAGAPDASELAAGGFAAGMGATRVSNAEVDAMIAMQRSVLGLTDDAAWEDWCAQRGRTVQEERGFVAEELLRRAYIGEQAAAAGVAIGDAAFEERYADLKSSYGADAFAAVLAETGFTEDAYRDVYRAVVDEASLREALFPLATYEGSESERRAAQYNAFDDWYAQAYRELACVVG